MTRTCNECSKEAKGYDDVFYDMTFSDNGSYYPSYGVKVLCNECFIQWVNNNPSKLVSAFRVENPVLG